MPNFLMSHPLDEFRHGEMLSRVRAYPWAETPLGAMKEWPQSLRSAVSIVLNSALPMYVAWGKELTLIYNDGYAAILGNKHPALGQPLKLASADLWHDLKPVVDRVLKGKSFFREKLATELPVGEDGGGKRYFSVSLSPVYDENLSIGGMFCACYETTIEVNAAKALQAEKERLRNLFEKAPGVMALFDGPRHIIESVNPAFVKMFGKRDYTGKPLADALPEIVQQGLLDDFDRAFASGAPYVGLRVKLLLNKDAGSPPDVVCTSFVLQPMRDNSDRVTGIMIDGVDLTDVLAAESERDEAARFARATIDALADHIAVIDAEGKIVAVNKAWRQFACDNGACLDTVLEGANYLDACEAAARNGDEDAATVADMLRTVASGKRNNLRHEYPCHCQSVERWFSVTVTRFAGDGPVRIVVAHTNITARKKSELLLAHLATHDPLTNLPNRKLLADRAEQAIAKARRDGRCVALLFVDLDGFKNLNDTLGHGMGDRLLCAFADELRSVVRASDTTARLGGDEFVVLLTDLAEPMLAASQVARASLAGIAETAIDGNSVPVGASIGISRFPDDGSTFEEMIKKADAAMYAAKKAGRNTFRFYKNQGQDKSGPPGRSRRAKVTRRDRDPAA